MDKKSSKSRQAAAQEFMSALHDLEIVLQSEGDVDSAIAPPVPSLPSDSPSVVPPVEQLLDEAVKDIENFMAEHPPDVS